jgi:hypothetical protein
VSSRGIHVGSEKEELSKKYANVKGWVLGGVGSVFAMLGLGLLVAGILARGSSPVDAARVTPTVKEGNPSCQDLGFNLGLKIEPVANGTTQFITLSGVAGTSFDLTSTMGIDAVIVKGGPNANLYTYDPPAEATSDADLTAPINPNNGQPYGLSHVEFCYDREAPPAPTSPATATSTPTAIAAGAQVPPTATPVVAIVPPVTGTGGLTGNKGDSSAESLAWFGVATLLTGFSLLACVGRAPSQR